MYKGFDELINFLEKNDIEGVIFTMKLSQENANKLSYAILREYNMYSLRGDATQMPDLTKSIKFRGHTISFEILEGLDENA